jgi:hypothetical protein
MAIKIQTEKTVIPVEFGNLSFEFDVSDESVKKFRDNALKIQTELNEINTDNEDESFELAKEALAKGYDLMLGKGAFNKIYKQTPSITYLTKYFEQLAEAINEELKELGFSETQQDKAKKYLLKK